MIVTLHFAFLHIFVSYAVVPLPESKILDLLSFKLKVT